MHTDFNCLFLLVSTVPQLSTFTAGLIRLLLFLKGTWIIYLH